MGAGGKVRRALITSYEYPPLGGGGGVIFRDLAEELARSLEVTVLTSGRAGLPERERDGALEIVRAPVWMRDADATASLPSMLSYFPSSLRVGRRLLGERSFDVVHTSFAIPSGPSGLLLARRARRPHVLSVHGGDVYDPSKRLSPHQTPLLRQTVRWVVQSSDRVVAESVDIRRRTCQYYGERDVDMIPLATRVPPFEALDREQLGLGLEPGDFVLASVGRLIPRKALDELLAILAQLGEPRARLVVVGEGPERSALEARAHELGVSDAVRFTGFVEEVRKWQILSAADVYVSTSLHEGFGIAFIEAMGAGLPVICYDRGGQADFVTDEVGRLLPLGDRKAFRDELVRFAAQPELRARLGAAARRLAAGYSIERYAERYRTLYEECVAPPDDGARRKTAG